jgi:hypothetical protein
MFADNQAVKLTKDLPESNLKAGARGTVVYIYEGTPAAYEVDFVDDEGITIALLTMQETDIEAI